MVDQPACTLWHIILRQFPEAKVILMERESPEAWFRSYEVGVNEISWNTIALLVRLNTVSPHKIGTQINKNIIIDWRFSGSSLTKPPINDAILRILCMQITAK